MNWAFPDNLDQTSSMQETIDLIDAFCFCLPSHPNVDQLHLQRIISKGMGGS